MGTVAEHDWATTVDMLTVDGRGGNTYFGFFDKNGYEIFIVNGLVEWIQRRLIWLVLDGGRAIIRWHETIPGTTPQGGNYNYSGMVEFIYAGNGQFCYIYSLPDIFGLKELYRRWTVDGQREIYGDILPGLANA